MELDIVLEKKPSRPHSLPPNPEREHPLQKYPDLLDKAGEEIHNEWMKRNPKQDYNAHLHVPYQELPKNEQEKDLEHLYTVCDLLDKIPRNQKESALQYAERLANTFGSIQHEKWRQGFDPEKSGKERIKNSPDGPTNINVPWESLHPEWKKENLFEGRAAVQAYRSLTVAIAERIFQEATEHTTRHLKQ
jgi:hypothetical protein